MTTRIENDATKIMSFLAGLPHDDWATGEQIASETGLPPSAINDAMTLLVDVGFAEWLQALGTHPFMFMQAQITPRGRYELERLTGASTEQKEMAETSSLKPLSPIGSPYGFTDEDWEIVAGRKAKTDWLQVVLGLQFTSVHYETSKLKSNVEAMILTAAQAYGKRPQNVPITVEFRPLEAGYGEHLFNEIARDIISADIAVFEASDLNPNVMLEMGVALTWGVRVLPIKAEGRPRPPSDISGQTWADYRNNAAEFLDPGHQDKLANMIERAVRKKARQI
jgi:hypothetical protein